MTAAHGAAPAMRRLTSRSQFLKAARGTRAGGSGFLLQVTPVGNTKPGVGFTVTKKTGNAPQRNRIKRRLRAVVAAVPHFRPGHDYVLIGRRAALNLSFANLVEGLGKQIERAHIDRTIHSRPQPK